MLPELSVREMLLYTAELKCVRFYACPHHLYKVQFNVLPQYTASNTSQLEV